MVRTILTAAVLCTIAVPSFADDKQGDLNAQIEAAFADLQWPGMVRLPIGVTPQGSLIWCWMDKDALDYRTSKVRVVMVGTLDGSPESVAGFIDNLRQRQNEASLLHGWCAAFIPIAVSSEATPTIPLTFPPEGRVFYGSSDVATAGSTQTNTGLSHSAAGRRLNSV